MFVGLILWCDVAGLDHLVMGSDIEILAMFLLWFFNGTVFRIVQFAISVKLMEDSNKDDGPRLGLIVPVRLPTKTKRQAH